VLNAEIYRHCTKFKDSTHLIHIRHAAKPLRSPTVNRDILYSCAVIAICARCGRRILLKQDIESTECELSARMKEELSNMWIDWITNS